LHGLKKHITEQIKDKITKQTPLCGKYNSDYTACLKKAVHFFIA
jgi:hypothetical protein